MILPGDRIRPSENIDNESTIILGPGLHRYQPQQQEEEAQEDIIISNQMGYLSASLNNKYQIDNPYSNLYLRPCAGDLVVGVVVGRQVTQQLEQYRVEIGYSRYASLGFLEFESATRRNRPQLSIGTVVYAVVKRFRLHFEPELSCVDVHTQKSTGMGVLEQGYLFKCSPAFCRLLLSTSSSTYSSKNSNDNKTRSKKNDSAAKNGGLLATLGQKYAFECVVGVNGVIWIKSDSIKNTIAIVTVLRHYADRLDEYWDRLSDPTHSLKVDPEKLLQS